MSHTLIPLTFQHNDLLITNLYPQHISNHIQDQFPLIPDLYHIQIYRHLPVNLPASFTLYDYSQHQLSHYTDPHNPFTFTNTPFIFPRKIPTEQLPLSPYILKHKPNATLALVRKHLR